MGAEIAEQSKEVMFVPGRVYMNHTKRRQLVRLICFDTVRDVLIFKLIEPRWNKVEKVAMEMKRETAHARARAGKLAEEPDYVRPEYLSLTDEELKEESRKLPDAAAAWLEARDGAYALIKDLVAYEDPQKDPSDRLIAAYSPLTSATVVNAHAKKVGIKPLKVKRLLHKYAWFGLDKNALLNLDPFKGRTGSFVTNYEAKPGRESAAVELYGEKYCGKVRTRQDVTTFLVALELFYVANHMNLRETYGEMVDHFYYQANQHGFFPIRRSYIPTFRQFSSAARKLIVRFSLDVKRAGHKDGKELLERRGHDTDIANEVGDVFDIDGTPFNKELVSTYKVNGKAFNIGKATAIVIFDRRSKKVIGWHVYVGTESWKEGYRLALFCALTSKAERLKWLHIDAPNAWRDDENILPSFVYVDGGPGASKKGQAALARLLIDFFRAPPDTPYWKPTVEGGLGNLQNSQAQDGGAYKRTKDAFDKDAKRNAKLFANATVWTLERSLVLDIIRYNRKLRIDARLTFEMKQAGLRPAAEDLFSWGVKKMGGVQKRRQHEADIYEALLNHDEAEATIDGIFALGARYQSDRLRTYRSHMGKNVKIGYMYHPLRLGEVYWRTPDGVVDRLRRDEEGNRNHGQGSVHDIAEYRKQMLALDIVETHKPRTGNMLSRREHELLLNAAGAKPKRQRKVATKNVEVARALEAGHHQATRPYDRPETNAPDFAADRGSAPSVVQMRSVPANSTTPRATPSSGPPLGASPPSAKPALPGRVRTADLFELRRQQVSQKSTE